jgi:uncharacterized protein (TIGR00645 family)
MIPRAIERSLFSSRWLLVPFLAGLFAGLVLLLLRFGKEIVDFVQVFWSGSDKEVLTGLLSLIELALIAALMVLVILSTYENFVARVRAEDHPDWPAWMGHIDFSQLKRKLMATAATIVTVQLLKEIESIDELSDRYLAWLVAMLLAFVLAALALSFADRIAPTDPHDPT